MIKKNKASILLYTLLILTLLITLTMQLVRNIWVGVTFDTSMIAREQAKMLALGGINLAISQLTIEQSEEKKGLQENKDPEKELKDFIERVFPNLNRWQEFKLSENVDGVDGLIKICITCENGKININEAFDFEKNEFKKPFDKLLEGLHIKGKLPEGEISKRLVEFFKKRKRKLDDISELEDVEGLKTATDLFYKPPIMPLNKKKRAEPNSTIYLQDLFTIWGMNNKLELFFCSDSFAAVFGLRRPIANDKISFQEKIKNIKNNFKKDWGANWANSWQYVADFFGPQPKHLKTFEEILSKEFGPQVYSVLSYGKVKNVEQSLLVVLKKLEEKKEDQKEKEGKEEFQGKSFKILRMYWL